MKIVIDIDEESYEHIKAYSNEEVLPVGWYAIINGTPLPKGHGRLIDADALIQELSVVSSRPIKSQLDILREAPTIIEGSESE